jgi:hypothetical protein
VFFARGTTETGLLGITVGPVLSSGLTGRDWSVVGVPYDADFAGDNCLGLPGGMVAKDLLNQAAKKCPESKLFMSGYSEGGMVSHNGVAYAEEETKKRVAVSKTRKPSVLSFRSGNRQRTRRHSADKMFLQGVITFGDPFQGAKIKGYDGPIHTYCKTDDGVCTGNFVVGLAHLSYTGADTRDAIAQIKKMAAAKG